MDPRPQLLFDHNPSQDRTLVRRLFCDRERELEDARLFLETDVFAPKVYAVYGPSRSGKSHLVLRLLSDLEGRFTTLTVNANERASCRAVLEETFFQLKLRLDEVESPADDPEGRGTAGLHEAMREHFADVAPLVDGLYESRDVQVSRQLQEKVGAKLGLQPVELSGESAETRGTRVVVRASRPHDRLLVVYLRELVDALWYATRKPVLLNVDDLDLVDVPGRPEGQEECRKLLQALAPLAAAEHCVVLASMRTPFFKVRDKSLLDFLQVGLVDEDLLKATYRLHVEELNGGEEVFDTECLETLIGLSSGRVGVFLRNCYRLWRMTRHDPDPASRGDVEALVRADVEDMLQDPATTLAMQKILDSVRAGQMVIDLGEQLRGLRLEDSPLSFMLVRETGFPGRVEVQPFANEVLGAGR